MKEKLFVCDVNPITGQRNPKKLYASANAINDEVDDDAPTSTIDERIYNALMDRIRWRGARKVKNYKFTGMVPEPKDVSYYSQINS